MKSNEFITWGRVTMAESYLYKCQEKLKNCINSCKTAKQLSVTLEWAFNIYDYKNISHILDFRKITNWRDRNYILDISTRYRKEIFELYNAQYDSIYSKQCTELVDITIELVKSSKNFGNVLEYINNVYERTPDAFGKCSQKSLATLFIETIKKI